MAITKIKGITVQSMSHGLLSPYAAILPGFLQGLPLPGQKNMLKLAFPAPKFRRGGDLNILMSSLYISENQLYITAKTGRLFNLSGPQQASTDFEFNKPILKKGVPILNDFEKNSTDFEKFRTIFKFFERILEAIGVDTLNSLIGNNLQQIAQKRADFFLYSLRQSARSAGTKKLQIKFTNNFLKSQNPDAGHSIIFAL